MFLKHPTLSLHFFRDARSRSRAHALATVVVAIFAVTERIGAAAEQGASHKKKCKTEDHEVRGLDFLTHGPCYESYGLDDNSPGVDLCKRQEWLVCGVCERPPSRISWESGGTGNIFPP